VDVLHPGEATTGRIGSVLGWSSIESPTLCDVSMRSISAARNWLDVLGCL